MIRKAVMVTLILVAVAAISAGTSYAGWGERGGRGGHRFPDLSEEQRAEVHELVSGMREAGASRDEIHAAVKELFGSWGIEMPDQPRGEGRGEGPRDGRGPGPGLMDQLSEEQQAAVHELVSGMRESGATREEIHAAVRELVQSWGIELPEQPPGQGPRGEGRGEGWRDGRGPRHWLMDQLNEEQRAELHKLVSSLHEAGASRDEIHAAVKALLDGWGIVPPEGTEASGGTENLQSPAEGESATWGEIKGDFR